MTAPPWVYDVWRLPTADPADVSALRERLQRDPGYEVLAVMGKTEGNGCVNDFSRTLAAHAYQHFLQDRGAGAPDISPLLIMSGGTEGVLSPHVSVFVRRARRADDLPGPALACGIARTDEIPIDELGRLGQARAVKRAVLTAMRDAAIENPADVHFVQIKCPLLTDARVLEARGKGLSVATDDTYQSMAYSRGASALGVAAALGEIDESAFGDEDVCDNWTLFSSVASVSAGAELSACEVLVLGNSESAAGPLCIGHAVMRDAIDAAAIRDAVASAESAANLAGDAKATIRQVFAKADPAGEVRGCRTTMFNDSDIQATRHARAAVGGLVAGQLGDPMVYVSGGAEHQGPYGGGPVAVLLERPV